MTLRQLISGGQTGADRAALDAALALGFPIGGYCPAGREAEDGPIDPKYPLVAIAGGYRARTRKNVEAADGTAIFYRGELEGGTEQTVAFCIRRARPYKLIDIALVERERAATALLAFIAAHRIGVLNVAGPRLSRCPPIAPYVQATVQAVLAETLAHRRGD